MPSHIAYDTAKTILGGVNMGANTISNSKMSWLTQYVAGWIDCTIDLIHESGGPEGISRQQVGVYLAKRGFPLTALFAQDIRAQLGVAIAGLALTLVTLPVTVTAAGGVAITVGGFELLIAALGLVCDAYPVFVTGSSVYFDATRQSRVDSEMLRHSIMQMRYVPMTVGTYAPVHGPR
jgi:hypothetical protein